MNTLALYLRVSNEDSGLGESATIQNQRNLLRQYLQNKPEFSDWNVLEIQDDGWSGTTFDRPGIQKLLGLAGKEISCILVKDFSRFGRNLIEVGDFLDQIFPFLGVRFIAVNENYDSKDNIGHTIGLDVSLRAMVYEMYSRDLSKKISSVKEGKMRKGQYAGSFSFFGYQRTNTTMSGLMADPEASVIVKRIFSLAAAGTKTKQIAIALNQECIPPPLRYRRQKNPDEGYQCPTATEHNVWTQDRIAAILKDVRYTSVLVSKKRKRLDISTKKTQPVEAENWIRVEDAIEPIITRAEYAQAQKIFHSRSTKQPTSPPRELFRGLLKCAYCGKTLEKVPNKEPYFRCATGTFHPEIPCAGVRVDKRTLETAILTSIQWEAAQVVDGKDASDKSHQPNTTLEEQLSVYDLEIKKCKVEKIFLFEQYDARQIDKICFLAEKQEIVKRIDALCEKQKELLQEIAKQQEPITRNTGILGRYASLQSLSGTVLTGLVKEIRVWQDDRIEIEWSFCDTNEVP